MDAKPSKLIWFSGTAVVFGTSAVVWMLLGLLTGVVGICATASEAWTVIYLLLGLVILPVSILAGYKFSKKLSRIR